MCLCTEPKGIHYIKGSEEIIVLVEFYCSNCKDTIRGGNIAIVAIEISTKYKRELLDVYS